MLRRLGVFLLPLAMMLVVVGCGGGSPQGSAAKHGRETPTSTPIPFQGTPVTGSRDGLTAATMDLRTGSTVLEVGSGDLGGDLYRVTTNHGQAQVSATGSTVQVDGLGGGNEVQVLLARGVHWTVDIGAGASKMWLDLGGADLRNLTLGGGAYQATVTLGPASGSVPVQVTGGMTDLSFGLRQGAGATIKVRNPIDSVRLAGTNRGKIAGGTTLQVGGSASDRYQIDLSSGLSSLDVSDG